MKSVVGLLSLVILVASSTASAQEPSEAGQPGAKLAKVAAEEQPERTWYGYQTLAADALAVTMTGLGVQAASHEGLGSNGHHTTSELLLVGGGLTYLLASPSIHALRGHWGKAGGSLALRAAPFALSGAIIGAGSSTSSTSSAREKSAAVGAAVLFIGIVAAMVIDSAVIAKESTPPPPTAALAPTYDPKTKTAGLAFATTF